MFRRKIESVNLSYGKIPDFEYIKNGEIYMDSSCQCLRPKPVIDSLNEYYQNFGACGGRVKYKWGQKVDSIVEETRELVVDYLDLSKKEYVCSFTLNSTMGLNLILSQLPISIYEKVVTSDIEHNSVFLPTISLSKRLKIDRKMLTRKDDGILEYEIDDLKKSVVVLNTTSNIDGRLLLNVKQVIKDTHKMGGIVILDAAQTMAHHHKILVNCGADAICFSAHKMYGASLGVIVIKKDLLQSLDIGIIGGGMVSSVKEQSYSLLPDDMTSLLEPGLQAYAEIISLNSAIKWLKSVKPFGMSPSEYINKLSEKLFNRLSEISGITIINKSPSSIISIYSKDIDSHRLATFLSASGIMVRSGYFCCHYYLLEKLKTPPLLRFSIGLHTTEDDILKTIETIKKITKG